MRQRSHINQASWKHSCAAPEEIPPKVPLKNAFRKRSQIKLRGKTLAQPPRKLLGKFLPDRSAAVLIRRSRRRGALRRAQASEGAQRGRRSRRASEGGGLGGGRELEMRGCKGSGSRSGGGIRSSEISKSPARPQAPRTISYFIPVLIYYS